MLTEVEVRALVLERLRPGTLMTGQEVWSALVDLYEINMKAADMVQLLMRMEREGLLVSYQGRGGRAYGKAVHP